MCRKSVFVAKNAAALLLVALPFGGVRAAESACWDWTVAPYLWAPAISSSVRSDTPPLNAGGTTQFSDVAGHLGFTVPLHIEGQGDNWGVFSDALYMPLSNTRHRNLFSTDASLKTGIFELGGVWRPRGPAQEGFEVFAGLRYLWTKFELKIDPVNTLLRGSQINLDSSFADLMVGARYSLRLSERWALMLRGDGSFGSTDGTYGLSGTFQYRTKSGAWLVGYRYMKLKFSNSTQSINLRLYGPQFAYAFKF